VDSSVRQTLIELREKYGRALLEDPGRLEAHLRDLAPGKNAEIHCLVCAVREGVVTNLETASDALPIDAVIARLADSLRERLAMDPQAARWAVDSLAFALGLAKPQPHSGTRSPGGGRTEGSTETDRDTTGQTAATAQSLTAEGSPVEQSRIAEPAARPAAPQAQAPVSQAGTSGDPLPAGNRDWRRRSSTRVLAYAAIAVVVAAAGLLVSPRIWPSVPGSTPSPSPASPQPSASAPISPSPSPTVTPPLSPSPSRSASPATDADRQMMDAIDTLQVGVIQWATRNDNLYPKPADASKAGGIARFVHPWPTNPYTGHPMKPGTQPGDYTYEQLNGGAGYKLTGYIAKGLTYTVP